MMKGTKPLTRPCANVMWVKGIIHARPKMYTEKRDTSAVGAIVSTRRSAPRLGGQTRDCDGEEVAEDVAEGSEGPADVRTGEDRSARDTEEGVRADGDEASARTQGCTHRQGTECTERDGHRREGQRDRDAGQDDHGERASGDQSNLADERAAKTVGENAVLARGDGGSGQGGHTTPFNRANGLSFNN